MLSHSSGIHKLLVHWVLDKVLHEYNYINEWQVVYCYLSIDKWVAMSSWAEAAGGSVLWLVDVWALAAGAALILLSSLAAVSSSKSLLGILIMVSLLGVIDWELLLSLIVWVVARECDEVRHGAAWCRTCAHLQVWPWLNCVGWGALLLLFLLLLLFFVSNVCKFFFLFEGCFRLQNPNKLNTTVTPTSVMAMCQSA